VIVTEGGQELEAKVRLARIGYDRVVGHQLQMRVAVFRDGVGRYEEDKAPVRDAERLGSRLAERLLAVARS
jgi:hypothetical protein